jgi:hypothetical protein
MQPEALLAAFAKRGITIRPDGPRLVVIPASKLSDADRDTIRQSKPALLRILSISPKASAPEKTNAAIWRQGATPNWRKPLVPPTVRAVIESIEVDARAKGWPPELLWNTEFWSSPRGLAALLAEGDAIVEVTIDYIAILKVERTVLRFQRRAS